MSRNIIHAFARTLPVASAALLIHIGTAAATTPQSDFQRQVSAVVAGDIARHSPPQASSTPEASRSEVDAQQFARQLLQGWSVSHPARAGSATPSGDPAAADVIRQTSQAREDVQSMVQRFLLGQTAPRNAS